MAGLTFAENSTSPADGSFDAQHYAHFVIDMSGTIELAMFDMDDRVLDSTDHLRRLALRSLTAARYFDVDENAEHRRDSLGLSDEFTFWGGAIQCCQTRCVRGRLLCPRDNASAGARILEFDPGAKCSLALDINGQNSYRTTDSAEFVSGRAVVDRLVGSQV